jgi:hypothetical protein
MDESCGVDQLDDSRHANRCGIRLAEEPRRQQKEHGPKTLPPVALQVLGDGSDCFDRVNRFQADFPLDSLEVVFHEFEDIERCQRLAKPA